MDDMKEKLLSVFDTLHGWCKNLFIVVCVVSIMGFGWGTVALNITAQFIILFFAYDMVMLVIGAIKAIVDYEWGVLHTINLIIELIALIAFTIIFFVNKPETGVLTWLAICIVAEGIILDVVTLPISLIGIFRDDE